MSVVDSTVSLDHPEFSDLNFVEPYQSSKITPEIAKILLAGNEGNRPIKEGLVATFVGSMRRGEWVYNGDAIRITQAGRLLDGQHRLQAVVESGVTIEALIVLVEDAAQETMDQGAKRQFGDYLTMRGEKNAKALAAATRLVWCWEDNRVPSAQNRQVVATTKQLFDVLDRHPGVRDSLTFVGRTPFVSQAFAAAHHYIFTKVDKTDADEFFYLFKTGDGLSPGHPIYTLRERLLREASQSSTQLHATVRAAFFARAFLAWRAGERLNKLQFKPGGAHPDRFPVVEPSGTE